MRKAFFYSIICYWKFRVRVQSIIIFQKQIIILSYDEVDVSIQGKLNGKELSNVMGHA